MPVAAGKAEGIQLPYLPRLVIRRIADLHAGEAKTEARHASLIAEAARTMPNALRSLRFDDEHLTELTMLCGIDDDLADQITRTSNRIRDLITHSIDAHV